MIVLWGILAFAVLALVLGAQRLLRLGRRDSATLADLEALFNGDTERHAHIGRVLGPEDFDFLAHSRYGSNLIGRLRARRTRTMAQYLRQIADEFDSLMAIGALFAAAPTAQAERFAQRLARQRLRFMLLFAGVWIRTYANYLFRWPVEMGRLTEQIRALRYDADRIMRALTPADLGALRNVLSNS